MTWRSHLWANPAENGHPSHDRSASLRCPLPFDSGPVDQSRQRRDGLTFELGNENSFADGSRLIKVGVARALAGEGLGLQLDRVPGQLGIDRPAVEVGRQLHGQSSPRRGPVRLVRHGVFASRTVKSWPRQTTLRQRQTARRPACFLSSVRASRHTSASRPAAVDLSPDDVRSVRVLHYRRRGTLACRNDRGVRGCTPHQPRFCHGYHTDRRRDHIERASRTRSRA